MQFSRTVELCKMNRAAASPDAWEELSIFHNSCSVFRFQYNRRRAAVLDFCHYHGVTYLPARQEMHSCTSDIPEKVAADSVPNFSHKGIVNTGGRVSTSPATQIAPKRNTYSQPLSF